MRPHVVKDDLDRHQEGRHVSGVLRDLLAQLSTWPKMIPSGTELTTKQTHMIIEKSKLLLSWATNFQGSLLCWDKRTETPSSQWNQCPKQLNDNGRYSTDSGFFQLRVPLPACLPAVLGRVQLFAIPGTISATRLLCPRNFPGKNIGASYHFLLQGISLTQGSNSHLVSPALGQVSS